MKIEEIIFWALFIVAIVVVLWYVFGNSPTLEQALLILILTLTFKNSLDLRTVKVDLSYAKVEGKSLTERFQKLEGVPRKK